MKMKLIIFLLIFVRHDQCKKFFKHPHVYKINLHLVLILTSPRINSGMPTLLLKNFWLISVIARYRAR